ncbi:hypothetical protein M378DRAFT_765571 [Amanita muscaria Koide BX008]|uniref:Uncharacterized protein n=1 Tax=Amanita muscaria (strain Koide BX008) TaxID=946122 RepID=A0A0C2SZZ5_AMAMK|nr:hypothetical protein M378DRAFT_765571 [Amanita muscaria Koide BX008]
MSKFLAYTQPPNLNPYPNTHNWNTLPGQSFMTDGVFLNTTNQTSDLFTSINSNPTDVYPSHSQDSYPRLGLDVAMPNSDSDQASPGMRGGSENMAPGDPIHEGEPPAAAAQSKSHRRSRKDEVDAAFMLPEGVTRAHKPRRLGDDSHWQGAAPKRQRRK